MMTRVRTARRGGLTAGRQAYGVHADTVCEFVLHGCRVDAPRAASESSGVFHRRLRGLPSPVDTAAMRSTPQTSPRRTVASAHGSCAVRCTHMPSCRNYCESTDVHVAGAHGDWRGARPVS